MASQMLSSGSQLLGLTDLTCLSVFLKFALLMIIIVLNDIIIVVAVIIIVLYI